MLPSNAPGGPAAQICFPHWFSHDQGLARSPSRAQLLEPAPPNHSIGPPQSPHCRMTMATKDRTTPAYMVMMKPVHMARTSCLVQAWIQALKMNLAAMTSLIETFDAPIVVKRP